jgi:hypothetical protein
MLFKNLLIGSFLLAATAFAQPADSTIKNSTQLQTSQITTSSNNGKQETTSIKKQQKIAKPTTTWSKIKDLFM